MLRYQLIQSGIAAVPRVDSRRHKTGSRASRYTDIGVRPTRTPLINAHGIRASVLEAMGGKRLLAASAPGIQKKPWEPFQRSASRREPPSGSTATRVLATT